MKNGLPGILIAVLLICAIQPVRAADPQQAPCVSLSQVSVRGSEGGAVAEQAIFESSYAEAECLRQLAAEKNAEWLKTKDILLQSREEADQGKWVKAIQLLETARFQAKTAIEQADREASAWQHRVIGYGKTSQ